MDDNNHTVRLLISFSLWLTLIAFQAEGATANNCALEKQGFLEGILRADVDEYLANELPPDEDHDVVKAIPTKRLGEWLELRFSSGILQQIRDVTPLTTTTFSWDASCKSQEVLTLRSRKKNSGEFSDDDLKNLLETTKDGVLYTISPNHPLSETSLAGVIENAQKYHLTLTLLTDPTISREEFATLKSKYPSIQRMESIELIYRGMFNHFPSTLVYRRGKIVGRPLLGARATTEIDLAFDGLLNKPYAKTTFNELSRIVEKPSFGSMDGQDTRYKIARKFHLPDGMHVKFIRSVPNSERILLFEAKGKRTIHLYDTKTEKIIRTWENMNSPYMSADGKFAVMLDGENHLVFQEPSADKPFFSDSMPAWYPGISVLKEENGKSYYRIITRMMDLKVQDYQIDFSMHPPVVNRLGVEHRVCTNLPTNATPYISRFDGDKFTLIQSDNSRQIVKLLDDGTCVGMVNLGFWTWKATFNFDDTQIGFTAVRVNSLLSGNINSFNQLFVGHSFVYDRVTEHLAEIPDGIAGSFTFPEFRSDGSIIVLRNDEGVIYKKESL